MRLIAITTETFFEGEAEAVNLLFDNGLEALHIRKPYASQHVTAFFIGQINKSYYARIVIHDYYELAKRFDLKGIHLNRRNQATFIRALHHTFEEHHFEGDNPMRSMLQVSRSCHSLEEVSKSNFCDYVFLSPIFDSTSKVGYKQGFTPEQLHEAKDRKIIDERVMALGGITTDKIPVVRSYGFGGVAVIGALWSDFAMNRNKKELLERFKVLNDKCNSV